MAPEGLWAAHQRLKAAEERVKKADRDALVSLAIVIAFALGAVLAVASLQGCTPALTPADAALVAAQTTEETACIYLYRDSGRDAQDSCRAEVRATWDAYWMSKFDGGGQ